MLINEIVDENYTRAWGRKPGGQMVMKYRCTSGQKKGRVVAKPSTCSKPIRQKSSAVFKQTRRTRGGIQALKRSLRLKHPTSKRLRRSNRVIRPRKKGTRR